jgi:hypothetical protein
MKGTVTAAQPERPPTMIPSRAPLLQRCGGRPCPAGTCNHDDDATLSRSPRGSDRVSSVPPIVRQVLKTPGDPLDSGILRAMEGRSGHDLGAIRIHADSAAAASARAVHAVAYTVGSHLVFDSGRYAPATPDGRALLIHEMTHAVQQGFAPVRDSQRIAMGQPDDAREREADRAMAADWRPPEREDRPSLNHQAVLPVRGRGDLVLQRQRPQVVAAGRAERLEFVQGPIHFLELSADSLVLATQMPPVARILERWRRMIETQGQMVLDDLAADPALYQGLRTAYKQALTALIETAARLSGRPVAVLYDEHRAVIPEWAFPTQVVRGITTPLPTEAQVGARGRASLDLSGLRVIFLPDGRTTRRRAQTSVQFNRYRISYRARNGRVVSFRGPGRREVRIQTSYPRGMRPSVQSGYGRGTTPEDVAAGETTLGFHEGQHGRDYLRFIRSHPYPRFTGQVGMTTRDFEASMADYNREVGRYAADIAVESTRGTDCVGTTIDQHNAQHGVRAMIECR